MEDKVRSILERPFSEDVLKQRTGPNGTKLTYAEIQVYIDRLNEAFSGAWTWELVRREQVEDQVVVEGRLTAGGITKTGLGGTAVTRRRDNGKMVCLADDLKTAEADAIKRACRLFGIGRDLYVNDGDVVPLSAPVVARPAVASSSSSSGSDARPNSPRITNAQLGKLRELIAEAGTDWGDYRNSVRDQYRVNIEYADRSLASRLIEELIARAPHPAGGNGRADANGVRRTNGASTGWRQP